MRKNTSRENRLEELGRVDAEHADTESGRRNLMSERRRVVSELKSPHHSRHIEELGSAYESNTVSSGREPSYHHTVTASMTPTEGK